MTQDGSFFDKVKQKTNVSQQDLFSLAQSVNNVDLTNPENVRKLIHQVAAMAQVKVDPKKEQELIKAITSKQIPLDFSTLSSIFQKK
ncbi:stage VI sporulation protein F [Paenalkalicoccus suaedae]|uniref:Stage VI sporulation protein F n=1 Tax=Paenalkalicoccus suaedae TaxID=2592382 RepID=A0A859FEE7_9BACI|nr:stage VI sporulation protein F [Paenalkalicoccus suaedae]QKS71082.1 stage VI sporulation protein F [Paenalkalicoccus suaedae]